MPGLRPPVYPPAIYVGRPTLFGNPWTASDAIGHDVPKERRAAWVVGRYREELDHGGLLSDWGDRVPFESWEQMVALMDTLPQEPNADGYASIRPLFRHLLKDATALVCWCPLDAPCHGDLLIELLAPPRGPLPRCRCWRPTVAEWKHTDACDCGDAAHCGGHGCPCQSPEPDQAVTSPCIETTWRLDRAGYGRRTVGGRNIRDHRRAWEAANGPVPDGLHVLHRCDRPSCVNVEHLFLGTLLDNNRDRWAKGRYATGTDVKSAKVTPNAVRAIIAETEAGASRASLARKYGIRAQNVSQIVLGRAWAHVSHPHQPRCRCGHALVRAGPLEAP